MVAPILSIDPVHPQPRILERAVTALQAGELIAYPTDSYYGLGCDMGSKRAIDRLYQLKGHDRKRPMSLIVPDQLGIGVTPSVRVSGGQSQTSLVCLQKFHAP